MIAAEIEVSVFEGETLLQRWPCSPTTMPDGAPGVLWRGAAYALLPDGRIDVAALSGRGGRRETLPHVVLPDDEASWVLLAGLAAGLGRAEALLRAGGIAVLRTGRWLGEPVEGVCFDWFLRVEGRLDPDRAAALLGAGALPPAPRLGEVRTALLEQRVAGLLAEVARLTQAQPLPENTAGVREREAAAAFAQAAADEMITLSQELDAAHAEVERLRAGRVAPRLGEELSSAFAALRPDIVLLRGSLTVVLGEYTSRDGVSRAMAELSVSGARPEGWKALRGAERWWERHVSTGQDGSGRAYARFDTASRQWSLLLGWKTDQTADVAWLRRH